MEKIYLQIQNYVHNPDLYCRLIFHETKIGAQVFCRACQLQMLVCRCRELCWCREGGKCALLNLLVSVEDMYDLIECKSCDSE